MTTKTEWTMLGGGYAGDMGQPGSRYHGAEAAVYSRGDRFRLILVDAWGSNQGYLEEHGRERREWRANSLGELLRVAITEARRDEANTQEWETAIRDACYAAEDASLEQGK